MSVVVGANRKQQMEVESTLSEVSLTHHRLFGS